MVSDRDMLWSALPQYKARSNHGKKSCGMLVGYQSRQAERIHMLAVEA
jgi:hypothetical protein